MFAAREILMLHMAKDLKCSHYDDAVTDRWINHSVGLVYDGQYIMIK
jgi:hypothetical protein